MTHEQSNPQNKEEQSAEEVRFTDKRRIDPDTGKLRDTAEAAEAAEQAEQAEPVHQDGETSDRDAMSQAEQIINDAAAQQDSATDEAPAEAPERSDSEVAEELRADVQRLQAEFVNYRRRVERDRDVSKDNAINSVLDSLLPVLDDLDAARAAGDLEDGPFAAIANKLDQVLASHGLERQGQDTLTGAEFDPAQHEAMLRQPSDEVPEEHIVQVLRNGYVRGERVLRAAQVMVSAGSN